MSDAGDRLGCMIMLCARSESLIDTGIRYLSLSLIGSIRSVQKRISGGLWKSCIHWPMECKVQNLPNHFCRGISSFLLFVWVATRAWCGQVNAHRLPEALKAFIPRIKTSHPSSDHHLSPSNIFTLGEFSEYYRSTWKDLRPQFEPPRRGRGGRLELDFPSLVLAGSRSPAIATSPTMDLDW
jgi:hypothetical protein